MSTIINAATVLRLQWVMEQIEKLENSGWIRLDGETVLRGLKGELTDVINTAVEPLSATPVVNLVAMEVKQVEALVDAAVARVEAIRVDLEGGELAVLDAIAQTRADVLGRMEALHAPAEPTEPAAA